MNRVSNFLYRHPRVLLWILLLPPLIWFVVVYLGALAAMLLNSFYSLNGFTGKVVRRLTLQTYAKLLIPTNLEIFSRTTLMAICVTLACIVLAFPLAYYMARFATPRLKTLLYLAVTLPLWSSYVVRVYSWKLILAQEGIVSWFTGLLRLDGLLNWYLALPVVGGPSLAVSTTGIFLVFVYIWLPYMILPIQTALERVPKSLIEAFGRPGREPRPDFSHRGPAAGASRSCGRFDLHLLAHARRLHRALAVRQLQLLHRKSSADLSGHIWQYSARSGLHDGARSSS